MKPSRFLDGLPVYLGQEAYKELFRLWGIPNWMPLPGETPFSRKQRRMLFVDDFDDGRPVAYWEIE